MKHLNNFKIRSRLSEGKNAKCFKASPQRWALGMAAILMATSVSATEVYTGKRPTKQLVGLDVATLSRSIPIGTWSITAKLTARNNNAVTNNVTCTLNTDVDTDQSISTLTSSVKFQTLSLNAYSINNSPGFIKLTCFNSNSNANTTLQNIRVTATRIFSPDFLHISTLQIVP